MKKILLPQIALGLLLFSMNSFAQLEDGSIAPNFNVKDINGNTVNLYSIINNEDRSVVIDLSAHWCGPCWNYHNSGALDEVWNNYGLSGTNEMSVIWVDASNSPPSTLALLQGGSGSMGDWTAGGTVPYPILGPNGIGVQMNNIYNVPYYPIIYMVCPDKTIYEVGQLDASDLYSYHINSCSHPSPTGNVNIAANVKNIKLFPNPATQTSTLNFSLAEKTNVRISIFNVLGEALIVSNLGVKTAGNHNFEINTSELSKGIYFVKLESDEKSTNSKLVVE